MGFSLGGDHESMLEKKAYELIRRHVLSKNTPRNDRPSVLLTYAQSLDGLISGPNKIPLSLSSYDSLVLTHAIRASHDGIIVGINTIVSDDPQLTARLAIRGIDGSSPAQHPTPIILDSKLRLCASSRICSRLRDRRPLLVLTTPNHNKEQRMELETSGVKVLVVDMDSNGWVCIHSALRELRGLGICRLMVEGGAEVIGTFLRNPKLFDSLVVTVSPIYQVHGTPVISPHTANVLSDGHQLRLDDVVYEQFGRDVVLFASSGW